MNRKPFLNQDGFLGCGGWIILIWTMIMLSFYGLIILNRNLFYIPPEEKVLTTMASARRCQEKLAEFENNKYVQEVGLSEMEINSALVEEFASYKRPPFLNVMVSIKPEFFTLKLNMVLLDILPKKVQEYWNRFNKATTIAGPGEKIIDVTKQEAFASIEGNIRITDTGLLEVAPEDVHIGKQYIPGFLVRLIYSWKPDLFAVNISHLVKSVELGNGELKLKKTAPKTED